jgi:hypothetical protein
MMRNIVIGAALAFALIGPNFAAEIVQTCQLADDTSAQVRVTREHRIVDTDVYKLQYAGKKTYFFGDEESSRGGPVQLVCVTGHQQRALVVYGEFMANYPQGFVLTYNASARKIERLDFAEKGQPDWLYVGESELIVILSTYRAGENGATPYVAYRHIKGRRAQPEPEGIELPRPPSGYDVIKLKKLSRGIVR